MERADNEVNNNCAYARRINVISHLHGNPIKVVTARSYFNREIISASSCLDNYSRPVARTSRDRISAVSPGLQSCRSIHHAAAFSCELPADVTCKWHRSRLNLEMEKTPTTIIARKINAADVLPNEAYRGTAGASERANERAINSGINVRPRKYEIPPWICARLRVRKCS